MTDEPSQSLADRVASGFAKIALVMRHEAWREAGARGLSPTQAQILQTIAVADEPPGLKAVAEQLALTAGTVSEAVRVLVEKGLVEKTRAPHDGRAIALALTEAGSREVGDASGALSTVVEAVREMSADQQAGLVRGLVATVRSLQRRGMIPTSRMCVGCRHFRPNVRPGAARAHHCAFLDEAIGDVDLRFDCPDADALDGDDLEALWLAYRDGVSLDV